LAKISFKAPAIFEEDVDRFREIVLSGRIGPGEKTEQLEGEFCARIGQKHGIATVTGTAALHLALASLNLAPGDEVIVPSFTFIAGVLPVLYCGAKPVFIDVDNQTWNSSLDEIRRTISGRTKALLLPHIFGNPLPIREIAEICDQKGIALVEDCAEAFGSSSEAGKVGTRLELENHISCFSMSATKIPTSIKGGIFLTSNDEIYERAVILANEGLANGQYVVGGFNYTLSDALACIALSVLSKADRYILAEKENARTIIEQTVALPLQPQKILPKCESNYCYLGFLVENCKKRDRLRKIMGDSGIETKIYFPPLHSQPIFKSYASSSLPNSQAIFERILCVPNHFGLSSADLAKIVNALNSVRED
jgi:perosamine synthetase